LSLFLLAEPGDSLWLFGLAALFAAIQIVVGPYKLSWKRYLAFAALLYAVAAGVQDHRAGVRWHRWRDEQKQILMHGDTRPL
jgi:hypothetical protein